MMTNRLTTEKLSTLSPKDQQVYEYLATGRNLTSMIAINSLGQGSVSRRITTLIREGLKITKTRGKDHFGKPYMSYSLPSEKE